MKVSTTIALCAIGTFIIGGMVGTYAGYKASLKVAHSKFEALKSSYRDSVKGYHNRWMETARDSSGKWDAKTYYYIFNDGQDVFHPQNYIKF